MKTFQSHNEKQKHYDRLHHTKRIADLDGPTYKQFTSSEAIQLVRQSGAALQMIDELGLATNSVDLNDSGYIRELDDFALQQEVLNAKNSPTK
ncbi:hypothetical protein SAMN05216264_12148 [Pseudomonas marincola]|nr:hypothetical protein SAMN05216264_12148 [Pseudomonas marincola]